MPVAEAAPPLAHPVPEAPRAPLTEKDRPQTANKKGKLPRGFRKWGRGLLQRVKQVAPLYRAVKKGEMRKTEAMFHLIANEGAAQPTGDRPQAELQAAEIPKQELAQDIAKASGKARDEMQQVNETTAARDAQEAQVRALQDQILHIQGEDLSPETRDKLIAAINERITNMIASPAVADNEAHNAEAIMTHAREVQAIAQARPPLETASSSDSPQGPPSHPEGTTPEQYLVRMKETQELQRKQQEARNAEVQKAARKEYAKRELDEGLRSANITSDQERQRKALIDSRPDAWGKGELYPSWGPKGLTFEFNGRKLTYHASEQPQPSKGESAYERWNKNAHGQREVLSVIADELYLTPQQRAAELQYKTVEDATGTPRPDLDKASRHLFVQMEPFSDLQSGMILAIPKTPTQSRIPTQAELDAFRQDFPLKATYYQDQLQEMEAKISASQQSTSVNRATGVAGDNSPKPPGGRPSGSPDTASAAPSLAPDLETAVDERVQLATEKNREEGLDRALEVDRVIDETFTNSDKDDVSAQAKETILSGIITMDITKPELQAKLVELVHHEGRIPELKKALDSRPDDAFKTELQKAREAEARKRTDALATVGIKINANGQVEPESGSVYANITEQLSKIDPQTADGDARRTEIWDKALNSKNIKDRNLVKTLALYHSQNDSLSQQAFEVVRTEMEAQIAAEDTADATKEEINTLFDHFARLPGVVQEHVNLVKDPKLLRQAERFAGYLFRHRQEVQVHEVVENAALVAKAKEEHQNAVFQLESVKEAQDIMQRHSNLAEALEELKQKRLETSQMQVGDDAEKEASKQRELAKIGNEQRLLSEIKTKAEGELPPQKNETPEQKQQREKAVNMREREMLQGAAEVAGNKIKEAEAKLQVPQAAFAEALKHVPQKTNNQFFKYLCNLPDWLQKYPQMREQLEALNKKAIGKKRLRPLLIMLIVLTLGSAPIFEEFQRMMKIQ